MAEPNVVIAMTCLVGLAMVMTGLLKAWAGWLRLKERELERLSGGVRPERGSPEGAARIELADLKERIRKLEAIANGVDL